MDIRKLWPLSMVSFGHPKAKQPTWLDLGIRAINNNDPIALKGVISSVDSLKSLEARMLLMHFTDNLADMSHGKDAEEKAVLSGFVAKTYLKLLNDAERSDEKRSQNLLTRVSASWKDLSSASDKHDAMMALCRCFGGNISDDNRPSIDDFVANLPLIENGKKKEEAALNILSFLPEGAKDTGGLTTLGRITNTVISALDAALQGGCGSSKDRVERYKTVQQDYKKYTVVEAWCSARIEKEENKTTFFKENIDELMVSLDNGRLSREKQQEVLQQIKEIADEVSKGGFPEIAITIYRDLSLPLMDPDLTTTPFEKDGLAGMFAHAAKLKDPNKALNVYRELIERGHETQSCIGKIMELRDREGGCSNTLHKALVVAAINVCGERMDAVTQACVDHVVKTTQEPREQAKMFMGALSKTQRKNVSFRGRLNDGLILALNKGSALEHHNILTSPVMDKIPAEITDALRQEFVENHPTFIAPKAPSPRQIKAYLAECQKIAPHL